MLYHYTARAKWKKGAESHCGNHGVHDSRVNVDLQQSTHVEGESIEVQAPLLDAPLQVCMLSDLWQKTNGVEKYSMWKHCILSLKSHSSAELLKMQKSCPTFHLVTQHLAVALGALTS